MKNKLKTKLFLVLFFFNINSSFVFCDTIQQFHEIENLKMKVDSIYTTVNSFNSNFDNSQYISNVNTYLTILAIILTVLAAFIAVLTIFNEIRTRREINNIRNTIYDHISKINIDLINTAINQLSSNSERERYEASLIISYNFLYPVSDEDFKRIITAYNKINENQTKSVLINFLSSKVSIHTEKFFRKLIKSSDLASYIFQILRYNLISESDFIPDYTLRISQAKKPFEVFKLLINNSLIISTKLTLEFINNKILNDSYQLPDHLRSLELTYNSLKEQIDSQTSISTFGNSILGKRINEKIKYLKRQEEEKTIKAQEKEEKSKIDEVASLIEKLNLHLDGKTVKDKDGNVYKPLDFVQTFFGFQEIQKAIKVDKKIIPLVRIK